MDSLPWARHITLPCLQLQAESAAPSRGPLEGLARNTPHQKAHWCPTEQKAVSTEPQLRQIKAITRGSDLAAACGALSDNTVHEHPLRSVCSRKSSLPLVLLLRHAHRQYSLRAPNSFLTATRGPELPQGDVKPARVSPPQSSTQPVLCFTASSRASMRSKLLPCFQRSAFQPSGLWLRAIHTVESVQSKGFILPFSQLLAFLVDAICRAVQTVQVTLPEVCICMNTITLKYLEFRLTKIKLPAGLCQPEPCLHAAGKDVNWARVVLWTTCSMDIADVSALASASGLFSLPMHTHTAYTAAEIVADIGGSGKRVAGLPPSAVPSVCASSNYAGNFSLALQQRHMTAKQPSPRPAFRRNTGVSLPKHLSGTDFSLLMPVQLLPFKAPPRKDPELVQMSWKHCLAQPKAQLVAQKQQRTMVHRCLQLYNGCNYERKMHSVRGLDKAVPRDRHCGIVLEEYQGKAIPSIPRKQQIFRKKVKERIGKEKTLHTNNTAEWHTDFTAKGNFYATIAAEVTEHVSSNGIVSRHDIYEFLQRTGPNSLHNARTAPLQTQEFQQHCRVLQAHSTVVLLLDASYLSATIPPLLPVHVSCQFHHDSKQAAVSASQLKFAF
ncbi:hypothetical protein Anapl_08658 [Anas platyrhynchos]|uniref:Uncharacterized protein n=1 Tax=Anas platyrhynchos TaxID=8839 RepID=R0JC17_ANAPL|nr:hypothetical protein Anapl_08658 [Anas platyrhynchos]